MILWKYITRPITFTLCVDDFGVKYVGIENAKHPVKTLNKYYEAITVDWEGKKFCRIDLEWDYKDRTCDIVIYDYVMRALEKLNYHSQIKKVYSLSIYTPPQYGQKIQMEESNIVTDHLSEQDIKELQKVIGQFLFYGRVSDLTMLHTLN